MGANVILCLEGLTVRYGAFVAVAGLDVVRDWQRVKPLFGYVPDRDNHFEELTGRRNLRLFAGLYGVGSARVEEGRGRAAGETDGPDGTPRAESATVLSHDGTRRCH